MMTIMIYKLENTTIPTLNIVQNIRTIKQIFVHR